MPVGHSDLENGANQPLTTSPAPARWGYTFSGWSLTTDGETTTSVTINGANITVYAIWTENHEVAGRFADNPYTVAQARAAIASGTSAEKNGVYTKGTIYKVESYNSTYNSITYWISDSGFGSTTNKDGLQVYGGLNIWPFITKPARSILSSILTGTMLPMNM